MTPEPITGERKELILPKQIHVGGPVGSGKTSLVKVNAEALGASIFEEEFTDNPDLVRFYTVDPYKYAAPAQSAFLIPELKDGKRLVEMKGKETILLDGGRQQNTKICEYLHSRGMISDKDLDSLMRVRRAAEERGEVAKPDHTIAMFGDPVAINQQVIDRARQMEIAMMKIVPDYFLKMAEFFNE